MLIFCAKAAGAVTSAGGFCLLLFCLIHQANYLLDQQLRQLEEQFLSDGGFTERLYRARQEARGKE